MVKARFTFSFGTFLLVTLLTAQAALAQTPPPSGTVSVESTSIAAGFGFSWGHGTLNFNGEGFRFSVDGMTILDFGISKTYAAGVVFNLADLDKFNGIYFATETNFALGGGFGSLSMRNQHGVVMHLNSVSQGARLQLGASGLTIKLWRSTQP